MVTGPYIGAAVIRSTGRTYEELGVVKEVPTAEIFLFSALVLLLIFLPLRFLRRRRDGGRRASLRPPHDPLGGEAGPGRPPPGVPPGPSSAGRAM